MLGAAPTPSGLRKNRRNGKYQLSAGPEGDICEVQVFSKSQTHNNRFAVAKQSDSTNGPIRSSMGACKCYLLRRTGIRELRQYLYLADMYNVRYIGRRTTTAGISGTRANIDVGSPNPVVGRVIAEAVQRCYVVSGIRVVDENIASRFDLDRSG